MSSARRGYLNSDTSAQEDDEGSVTSNMTGIHAPPALPSGSSIVKQGWLQKSDPKGGHWKQRWCVLLTNAFYYYVDSEMKDSKLKGAFELKQAKLVMGWDVYNKKSPTTFVFQLQLPKRQYFFCGSTQSEMLEWKAAIESALGLGPGPLQLQQSPPDASGGVLYEEDYGAQALASSATSLGVSNRDSGQSGLSSSQSSFGVSMYSPSAYGSGIAPRQPLLAAEIVPVQASSNGLASALPENITFYVLVADPARGADRHYTMMVRSDKVAALTFGKVRRNLSKTVGVPPECIVLTVEGDNTPIEDSWSGQGLIHNLAKLRMTLLPLPGDADALTAAAVELQQAAADTAPLPPHSRGKLLSPSQPLFAQSSGGGSSLSSKSPASSATGDSSAIAIAALDRRARLRHVFDSVAAGGRSNSNGPVLASAAVSRADLAQALSADPTVASMPEHEALLWRLLGSGPSIGSSPEVRAAAAVKGMNATPVTWNAFSTLLDLASADTKSGRVFRPASPPKRGPPPSPGPAPAPAMKAATPAAVSVAAARSLAPTAVAVQSIAAASVAKKAPFAAASAAAGAGDGSSGPRHVMIIKVDVPGGAGEAFIRIRAGDDARQLAGDFIREHGLSAADYMEPLAEEVRKMLVDAYALELADERAAHAATKEVLSESRSKIDAGAATTAAALSDLTEVAGLRRRTLELEGQLKEAAAAAATAAAEKRAKEDALQASLDLRRQIVARTESEAQLRLELAEAQAAATAAEQQTAAVSDTLALLEKTKRSQAWDRYVDGHGNQDTAPLPGAAADWRTWAAEKRELLERSNADRTALVEENKRLRSSLDSRGIETEARLRSADDELARLRAELHSVAAARNQAEGELRSVYQQWEADGRRWAGERRKQTDQMESLVASVSVQPQRE